MWVLPQHAARMSAQAQQVPPTTLDAFTGLRLWYPPRARRPEPPHCAHATLPAPLQRRHAVERLYGLTSGCRTKSEPR